MRKERPCVLSIAGFDPSGGAGLLADSKTFEQNKVSGMGVVTGITFQSDSEFEGVKWIETNEIIKQIEALSRKFKFEYVKIGMIKDLETLDTIVSNLKSKAASCKIVWDPIIKSSSGFEIHKGFEKEKLASILKRIFLLTPNTVEMKIIANEKDEMKAGKELSKYCNIFLTGGHSKEKQGRDLLFTSDGKAFPFRAKKISNYPKHGSGCVLSSAITANLAGANNLQRSCLKAKDYVTKFLMSNKTLLGYHKT